MTSRRPRLLFDPLTIEHDTGHGHPERPARMTAIGDHLRDSLPDADLHTAPPASNQALETIHTPAYIDAVFELRGQHGQLDPDTVLSPKSVDAALAAAGMSIAAVEAVIDGEPSAFALVRPPGHHAETGRGMGFCIFNNVAIAATQALRSPDIERVLIVDWDVHHGNGTQQTFYDRSDVLFFSTHQSPFYPGTGDVNETGSGDAEGTTVNIPLPAGSGDAALIDAFQSVLVPVSRRFDPDLVMISAGFDAHCLDPVGGMQVTTDGFRALTSIVADLAARHADRRLALILEGGYHLDALARSVGACIDVLTSPEDFELPSNDGDPIEPAAKALERARQVHRI